jgi:amino acid transporter
VGAKILLAGVVVAMFDTGLAGNLGYARIFLASARDGMWPRPVGRFFSYIGPTRVPVLGFVALFVGNGLFCIFTSLQTLISFTGVVIVTIYLLVAVSALVCRIRDRDLRRDFRMPVWPVPPVIAIVGVALALKEQTATDLYVAFGFAVAALVGYLLVRRRLPARLDALPSDEGLAP